MLVAFGDVFDDMWAEPRQAQKACQLCASATFAFGKSRKAEFGRCQHDALGRHGFSDQTDQINRYTVSADVTVDPERHVIILRSSDLCWPLGFEMA